MDQDLATLRDGGAADTLIERLRLQVGRLDLTPEELAGRNQRSALFKTMFLAFRQAGAKDWNSNLAIALDHSGTQHKLQFHHIFPKAVLTKLERTAREADDIANLAFIAGKTNQKISNKPPTAYLTALRDAIGPATFMTQCIPVEDELLDAANYDQFLVRRRELIADRLNAFLGTDTRGRVDLDRDPGLADLDKRVERVELELRTLVGDQLAGDRALLPIHVAQRIDDRVAGEARKNPAIADAHHETLERRLEYCDLRDLQDVITAKLLWPTFEARFRYQGEPDGTLRPASRATERHTAHPDPKRGDPQGRRGGADLV